MEKEGVLKEVSVLTDILFMHKHGGCKAGEDSITYAPDGMSYICPAFYSEGKEPIGKLYNSADIKNGVQSISGLRQSKNPLLLKEAVSE